MEDKKISEKESLALIAHMIQETQERYSKYAAYPLLIWGYTTVLVTLSVWALFLCTHSSQIHYLWIALPLIAFPLTLFCTRNEKKVGVRNYVDRVIGYIWKVIGTAGGALSVLAFFVREVQILFLIALLTSIAAALAGLVSKFRFLAICGVAGIALSLVFPFISGRVEQLPLFAFNFVLIMIIPGHILHRQLKRS